MSKQLPYLKHWFWLIQQYTIDFTFTFSLFRVFWTVNFAMKWLPYDWLSSRPTGGAFSLVKNRRSKSDFGFSSDEFLRRYKRLHHSTVVTCFYKVCVYCVIYEYFMTCLIKRKLSISRIRYSYHPTVTNRFTKRNVSRWLSLFLQITVIITVYSVDWLCKHKVLCF